MPSATLEVKKGTAVHKRIVDKIQTRVRIAITEQQKRRPAWIKAEETILGYVPENEDDAWRRHQRDQKGRPAYTTMKIPYSFAQLMAAHTYWTTVFFGRQPIHQFQGNHGEGEMQVQAMEALVNYQVEVGRLLAPYYIWLYDAGKYGMGIVGEWWDQEEVWWSEVQEVVNPETGKPEKFFIEHHTMGYEGNRVYNVSPWDFYPDPRVTVGNFQQGEFMFVERKLSWEDILQRQRRGRVMNVEFLQGTNQDIQFVDQDQTQLERPRLEHISSGDSKHPEVVRAYEFYITLVPSEWGLPGSQPQKWVFLITQDLSTLLAAQPLGHVHGKFPFSVLEPEVEAYGISNRGIPEIIEPIQNTMDWLLNSHMYNVRAVLNNLFVADPTRVVMKDLESPSAGGVIRVKPEAYGQDIRQFIHQVPINDVTQSHVNDLGLMNSIGERVLGISDQLLGVQPSGGRRTATESRITTSAGANRLKTNSEYMSVTGFGEHAQRLTMNSQQFYTGDKKFRIVGDFAKQAGMKFMQVTPESILGSYALTPVDGNLPIDRLAQANLWREMFIALRNLPEIGMQYDMARIFSWVATLGGLKNIEQFRIQVQPDAQLQQEAQQGNVIPIQPGPRPGLSNPAGTGAQTPTVGAAING